jgi:hypothetical protein
MLGSIAETQEVGGRYRADFAFRMGAGSLCEKSLPLTIRLSINNGLVSGDIRNSGGGNSSSFCSLYHNGKISGTIEGNGDLRNVIITQEDAHSAQYSSYAITGNINENLQLISKSTRYHPTTSFRVAKVGAAAAPGSSSDTQAVRDEVREAFNSLEISERKRIQTTLTTLGLYTSSIDGLYGPRTKKALQSYIRSNNLETVDVALLRANLLDILNAQVLPPSRNSNIISEERTQAPLEARNYIADIETYVASGESKFDLTFALEFEKVREIRDGAWSSDLSNAFTLFQAYANREQGFVNFHELQSSQRRIENEENFRAAKENLFNSVGLLRTWAKANLLDPKAADTIKLISEAESALLSDNATDVVAVLEKTVTQADFLGLNVFVSSDLKNDSPYIPDAIYIFGNFSGTAPHIFKGINGDPQLSGNLVDLCLIGTWDKWLQYTVFDFLNGDLKAENITVAERSCVDNHDIIAISGAELIEDKLPPSFSIAYQQLHRVDREESKALQARFSLISEIHTDEVLRGQKQGFGLLQFNNNSEGTCVTLREDLPAHSTALLSNYDVAMLYGEALTNLIRSDNVLDAFRKIQRNECSFVYGNSADIATLIEAGRNNNLSNTLVPIWVSSDVIKDIVSERTEAERRRLSDQEARNQQATLAEQAREAARQKAVVQQAELRERYDVRFSALVDKLTESVSIAVDFGFEHSPLDTNYHQQYLSLEIIDVITERSSAFDPMIEDVQNLALEKWEKTALRMEKLDYGSVVFNGRELEGIVIEVKVSLKNRIIGEFETYCKKIRAVQDDDFDMWRQTELDDCDADDNQWKLSNEFVSRWIVETGR